ncbi:hypothetical protein BO70DRAFT_304811, partial [Aspergillus heteromorphus CBS 117.55]
IPKFDDRFARQNRCEPPPEFPLASPYSGIVHHLSGPHIYALTQIHPKTSGSVDGAPHEGAPTSVRFHFAHGFDTRTLAVRAEARSSVRAGRIAPLAIRCPGGHYIPGAFDRPPKPTLAAHGEVHRHECRLNPRASLVASASLSTISRAV